MYNTCIIKVTQRFSWINDNHHKEFQFKDNSEIQKVCP